MTNASPVAPTPPSQASSDKAIQTRRMNFEESLATLPKHFAADGDPLQSHLAASLSAVFPDGEDFFVRSVRHFRNDVTDPVLKKQVGGFIGQEAVHGREHRAFNNRLDELGYPTLKFAAFVKWGLGTREKYAPAKANLAATAALEHYTATLAELLLAEPEMHDLFGDNAVRDLFQWHALEELEHKAVAFDVYKAVGGSERLRTITMNLITVGFILEIAVQMVISVAKDPDARSPRKLWKSWKKFRRSPFFSKTVWRKLRDYNRRDFHPDDHDTSALEAEWRERLFGESGVLNDKLAA